MTGLSVGGCCAQPAPALSDPQQDFCLHACRLVSQIREIQSATKDLNDNISRIQELHARSLDTLANDAQHNQINSQLSQLTDDTRQLSNSLKGAIKRLESQTAKKDPRDPNTNVRRTQCGAVKNRWGRKKVSSSLWPR